MATEESTAMAVFDASKVSNPAPLGYIKPVAGTPLQVTSNFTNLDVTFAVQSLSIQAHPSNTGLIYVLSNSSAADTASGTNILAVLSAGQSIPFNGIALGGIHPAQFWIDASAANQIAIPAVFSAA